MKKDYFEWANEYPDYVVLRKEGWLWRTKEESAFVLANVMDYQIMERENGIRAKVGRISNRGFETCLSFANSLPLLPALPPGEALCHRWAKHYY